MRPTRVTYNALLAACGQGEQWEAASAVVVAEMQREGVWADLATYNTLLAVCADHGQWEEAMQVRPAHAP